MTNREIITMFFISMSISMLFISYKMEIKYVHGFDNMNEFIVTLLNFWAGFTGALSVSVGSLIGYFFVEYFKKKEDEQCYSCYKWPGY